MHKLRAKVGLGSDTASKNFVNKSRCIVINVANFYNNLQESVVSLVERRFVARHNLAIFRRFNEQNMFFLLFSIQYFSRLQKMSTAFLSCRKIKNKVYNLSLSPTKHGHIFVSELQRTE